MKQLMHWILKLAKQFPIIVKYLVVVDEEKRRELEKKTANENKRSFTWRK
jgi:hypothetical protein